MVLQRLRIVKITLVHFSSFLIDGVGAEEAAGLDLVLVDDELWEALSLLEQHFLGHHEELVEVHLLLLAEVLLDLLLRLRLLSRGLQLVQVDQSVLGLVGIEGVLDLDDLVLVEALIEVLLDLEVAGEGGVAFRLCVSHLKVQKLIYIRKLFAALMRPYKYAQSAETDKAHWAMNCLLSIFYYQNKGQHHPHPSITYRFRNYIHQSSFFYIYKKSPSPLANDRAAARAALVVSSIFQRADEEGKAGLQFQQQKSISMRTLVRRNTRNEPCKSPSPDLAAKNMIRNTTIEVEDIRSKMRKAEEREPRFDLESSISQIAPSDNLSLDHKYRQVVEEFSRLKHENRLLADQNRLLNQENQRLNLQEERSRNISQLNSVILSKHDSEALREKVLLLDEEKKRLERELGAEREKSEQSFRNMDKLRLELLSLRGAGAGVGAGTGEQESRFMLLSNSILGDYQERMGRRLEELNFRISRIEMMEKIIKEQHSRLASESRVNKTPSSVKSNWANNTTLRNDSRYKDQPQTQERSDRDPPLPLSGSPIDHHYRLDESVLERLEQENLSLAEELRLRDSEIERMKIERERMAAVVHDLELERKAVRISTPKFHTEDNLRRFSAEDAQPHEFEQVRLEKEAMREELEALEGSVAVERREFATKVDYLQKIIKFYEERQGHPCEQCARKDEEVAALKDRLSRAEQRFEASLSDLQHKFQAEIEDYQRKLEHSESAGSEKFRTLEDEFQRSRQVAGELVVELGNYKMMLEYIKDKIHLDPIAHLLSENTAIYSEVESTFCQEREEYDRSLASCRQEALEKEQQVAALEGQLQLKAREAELLREEVDKLRQVNLQLQDNSLKVLRSNLKFMGRERLSKAKTFESNTEKVLELVRSGETKLDILYQKVNNTLNYDLARPKRP